MRPVAGGLLSKVSLSILPIPNFSAERLAMTSDQRTLFIFPGQGSQYVGMGGDLHEKYGIVKKIYAQASDVLGYDIAELSFGDPKDQLNQRTHKPLLGCWIKTGIVASQQEGGRPLMCLRPFTCCLSPSLPADQRLGPGHHLAVWFLPDQLNLHHGPAVGLNSSSL